jgi:hypothetical protein
MSACPHHNPSSKIQPTGTAGAGREVALGRWPTTIGGWKTIEKSDGSMALKYKESVTGDAIWPEILATPTWHPATGIPTRKLLIKRGDTWEPKTEIIGPGYRAAYGGRDLLTSAGQNGRRMQRRDARQAVEVGRVQGEDLGHPLRQHHRCKAGVMRALATDLGGLDKSEPAFESNRPFIEQQEPVAQARYHLSGLARMPSKAVRFYRSSGDDPQFGQYLRRQNQRMARRNQATDRLLDHFVLRGGRLHQPDHNVGVE